MSLVKKYLKKIIKKQKEIGYKMPEVIQDGLSYREINHFESKYGFDFNQEFRDYFKCINGIIDVNKIDSGHFTLFPPLFRLVSLIKLEGYIKEDIFNEIRKDYEAMDFSPLHFPIIYESEVNCYWVNLDTENKHYGYILKTTMWGDIDYVYSSISKFFETIWEAYERNCLFMSKEHDGHIDIDISKYKEIAKEINPRVEYWK